jgi:hypothetical protein
MMAAATATNMAKAQPPYQTAARAGGAITKAERMRVRSTTGSAGGVAVTAITAVEVAKGVLQLVAAEIGP